MEVRRAVPDDAAGIAAVHVASWQETYAHLVPPEDLARQDVRQRELRWAEIVGNPEATIAVAIEDGVVVGFAGSAVSRRPDPPRPLELESIYLLGRCHGSGAGQRLLDLVVGSSPAFLWVAEDNPRARAFYARNGFLPDGATDEHSVAGHPVHTVRLVR